jgi:hypothetical protein
MIIICKADEKGRNTYLHNQSSHTLIRWKSIMYSSASRYKTLENIWTVSEDSTFTLLPLLLHHYVFSWLSLWQYTVVKINIIEWPVQKMIGKETLLCNSEHNNFSVHSKTIIRWNVSTVWQFSLPEQYGHFLFWEGWGIYCLSCWN